MSKESEVRFGTCFGCIPLRAGVAFYAAAVMFLSVMAFAGMVTEDTRLFAGGYTFTTRIIVAILGVVCFFSSLSCLVGVSDNTPARVRDFMYVAGFRVLVLAIVFYVDYRALQTCEEYSGSGDKVSSVHDAAYNVALSTVALAGKCYVTREFYITLMVLDLVFSVYGYLILQRLDFIVTTCPMYLIHIKEAKPVDQYAGYSSLPMPIQTASVDVPRPTSTAYAPVWESKPVEAYPTYASLSMPIQSADPYAPRPTLMPYGTA